MEVNDKIYKMKTFNITVTSRNKNSIKNFFLFLNKTTSINLNIIQKYFQEKTRKKKLTILKSPHVNKKAQEQFESRVFKKQLTIQVTKNFKYLIFFKKLSFDLFPDIKIKLQHIISDKNIKKLKIKIFKPNNFKINKYSGFQTYNLNLKYLRNNMSKHLLTKKTNFLLKIFDLYGEF